MASKKKAGAEPSELLNKETIDLLYQALETGKREGSGLHNGATLRHERGLKEEWKKNNLDQTKII